MPDSPVSPAGRHAAVVFNPTKVDETALRDVVATAQADAGWDETTWYPTTVEDTGALQAKLAVSDGAEVVIAVGGDGTIRAVAEGLRGRDVPIALIPSGTGNLLARNLNLSLARMSDSVATAFAGVTKHIDIGVVEMERADGSRETRAFVVMAGLGLDAAMIANTDPQMKKRVGWLAYVGGIARSLKGDNAIRLRFKLDDQPSRASRVHTVLIGNCGLLTGNILLLPEAAIDDGVFDIVALRPDGLVGWFQIAWKVLWENGVLRRSSVGRKLLSRTKEVRTLRYLKGKQIVLRPEEPQEFQIDGDTMGLVIAVRARIEPLALAVRIPADEQDRLPASDEAKDEHAA